MQQLFPELRPYHEELIPVGPTHRIHITQSGNPDGIPLLVLHGGPGGGQSANGRRFFDPDHYRIIQYDQRGCGQSTPHGELSDNTTNFLLEDMEKIREHLEVEQWILFGGSWGTTLALLYAQQHTDQVLGLILRGVFLGRDQDLMWLYRDGASRVFPDHWKKFIEPVNGAVGHDLIERYYQLLNSGNELQSMSAAKSFAAWEGLCATLAPSPKTVASIIDPKVALPFARIATHYFVNRCFIHENQILEHIDKISHLPAIIVHGRYDMICPLENAMTLYDAWPEAELDIVRQAGHSQFEAGIIDALMKAARTMAQRFGKQPDQA
jgi:proline iminopeptidase